MKREPGRLIKTPLDDLTYQIIGCAMEIHSRRGPVFKEVTYQNDMEVHLLSKGFDIEPERKFEVYDTVKGDVLIGYYIPDIIVAGKVVVELKALHGLDDSYIAQVISYLAVTGCEVGLLINFGKNKLQVKRILPPKDLQTHRANRQWLWVPNSLRTEQDTSPSLLKPSSKLSVPKSVPLSVPSVLDSDSPSVPFAPQSAFDDFVRRPCNSESDYLSAVASTNRTVEWFEGELIQFPPNTMSHQLALGNLLSAFTRHVGIHDLGKVLPTISVKLWSGTFRTPDLVYISKPNQNHLHAAHCENPDLVVEVTSEATHELDTTTKCREYAKARIPEYWIADPKDKTLTVLTLQTEESKYTMSNIFELRDRAQSALMHGFEVNLNDVFGQ